MKYCSKCGKQLFDEAVICPGCGCAVSAQAYPSTPVTAVRYVQQVEESPALANCALTFAFLVSAVGLILGIIGAVKYKTPSYKGKCVAAIVISAVFWFIAFIILMAISMETSYYYY